MIQRRVDVNVTFERDCNAYVRGFGSPGYNYWAGLEVMHLMTFGCRRLKVYVEASGYAPFTLTYDNFQV